MKAYVNVSLENGRMAVESNVNNTERVSLLEAGKYLVLQQSMVAPMPAPEGRPPAADPGRPVIGRAPGFDVRRLA